WGAAVYRGGHQDRAGIRAAPGARRTRGASWSAAAAGHSGDTARCAAGAARSPGGGPGTGTAGSNAGARVFLRAAGGRGAVGGGHPTPVAPPAGGRGITLPTWRATPGNIRLQACLDPRRGISVPAAQHAAAVSSPDCRGAGGAVSLYGGDATR